MIRWWRRRRARAQAEVSTPAPGPMLPSFRGVTRSSGDFVVTLTLPALVRPAEFGPLLQPLDVVERIRTAVFRDQMKALAGRFAQRAEDFQDEFVERWGLHWTYDYVAWMTA